MDLSQPAWKAAPMGVVVRLKFEQDVDAAEVQTEGDRCENSCGSDDEGYSWYCNP